MCACVHVCVCVCVCLSVCARACVRNQLRRSTKITTPRCPRLLAKMGKSPLTKYCWYPCSCMFVAVACRFSSTTAVSVVEHRDELLGILEELHWPIPKQDVMLLLEELSTGRAYLEQSVSLRSSSSAGTSQEQLRVSSRYGTAAQRGDWECLSRWCCVLHSTGLFGPLCVLSSAPSTRYLFA